MVNHSINPCTVLHEGIPGRRALLNPALHLIIPPCILYTYQFIIEVFIVDVLILI